MTAVRATFAGFPAFMSSLYLAFISGLNRVATSQDRPEFVRGSPPRCRDLAFNLFEALRILAFQQRRGKNLSTVLGGGAVFHQGLAS